MSISHKILITSRSEWIIMAIHQEIIVASQFVKSVATETLSPQRTGITIYQCYMTEHKDSRKSHKRLEFNLKYGDQGIYFRSLQGVC